MRWIPPPRIAYVLLIMLLGGAFFVRSDSSFAQPAYLRTSQEDQAEGAYAQIFVIDCDFATGHDRVVVYDQNRNPAVGEGRSAFINFDNAVWIFDAGADGSAQLIVRFASESGQVVAYLFDDRDGDGEVAYRASGGEIIINESENWHVKVAASPAWTTRDGSVNPNLSFFIDGSILRYLSWGEAFPGLGWASHNAMTDGELDWMIEVVDLDRDGIADYQLQRLLSAFPEDLPVFRSTLYVNEDHAPALPYPYSLFWPLLIGSHAYETYNYFDHPPVIAVDWGRAKIDRVGILGYPAEQGYHINSRAAAWAKGQVNHADFENPIAYYDLAGDQDGRPELFVRFEVFAPHDRFFLNSRYPEPMTQVEYAWDQDNDGRWDYQLSLGGANPVTSTVDFPDFSLRTVPYAQIPAWVTTRSWAAAVFVAAQDGGYWNSEGMSLWNVNRGYRDGGLIEPSGLRDGYLTGSSDRPPVEDYSEIPPGFRGEVAFEYFREPTLYFSAIDQSLHLKYATSGVWVIDANREIRYSNLAGGAYLDHWEYYTNGTLEQELALLENLLLYAGGDEVRLRMLSGVPALTAAERTFNLSTFKLQHSTVEGPALFEMTPPRNHAEWLKLGGRLGVNATTPNSFDFLEIYSMAQRDQLLGDPVPGDEIRIRQATLHDLRWTGSGFRFVLELCSGYSVVGPDFLGVRGRPVGSYLVNYDGEFRMQALTPVNLELRPGLGNEAAAPLQEYIPGEISLGIENRGLADAHQVTATARIFRPDKGQETRILNPQIIEIPGGQALVVKFPWTPGAAGTYSIQLEVVWLDENEEVLRTKAQKRTLTVLPAEEAGELETFGVFGLISPAKVILLVALVVAAGGFAVRSILYPQLSEVPSVILVLLLAAVLSLYWIGRYAGHTMEVDASRMTRSADGILKVGHLVHEKSYPPGYEYPALLAVLSRLTGLSIQILQLNTGLWLPLLGLVAYLSYRELLGRPRMAVLTSLLLLIQPDFTFYVLRSSHEKITWMLALCSLLFLARSNRLARMPGRMLLYESLFCLVFWAMATTNAYFALVFLAGLSFYWLGARIICWRIRWQGMAAARRCQLVRRAGMICLIGYALVFIVINFAYPPAVNFYQILNSFAAHLRGLFSGAALKQPYAYLGSAWRNPIIYLALALAQWSIVLAGLVGWSLAAKRLGRSNQSGWLLWLLYAAFGAMLMAGVVMDFAGFLSLNLQLRLFPPFALAGSPFAAGAISKGFEKVPAAKGRVFRALGVGLGTYAVLAAMAKATNEPLLGNQWLFYLPAELQAIRWTEAHLESRRVWSDTSSHLVDVFGFWEGYGGRAANRYEFGAVDLPAPHVLISRWTRLQANRNGVSLPATLEHNRVYDNGLVQLYHRRPKTPYQH